MFYSRITGYYGPIQNWNDGKTQEYKERKVYSPEKFENVTPKSRATVAVETAVEDVADEDKVILFATSTCPNCKMAVHFLKKAGIEFEEVFANDHPELAKKFDVKQAPTLVVISGNKIEKITNLSNIRAFTEQVAKQV